MPSSMTFMGTTPVGPIGLSIPHSQDDAQAPWSLPDCARVLQACEGLIQHLETWLNAPWDPAPLGAETLPDPLVNIIDDHLAPHGTRLHLPVEALLQLPCEWSHPGLQWRPCLCDLELDCRSITPTDLMSPPQEGDVWLIPASFRPPWTPRLRPQAPSMQCLNAPLEIRSSGHISLTTHDPRSTGQAAEPLQTAPPKALCRVIVRSPLRLSLNRLLPQWPLPSSPLLAQTLDQLEAAVLIDNRPHAIGHLLPMGDGWGLRIAAAPTPGA